MDHIFTLKNLINTSNHTVVLTGAGISVPSGIPDFRSAKGIFNNNKEMNINPEEILSYSYFRRNPEIFYEFYRNNMIYTGVLPNIAHKTLQKLESLGKVNGIITQNIDGLHQLAGSHNVIELHGSIHNNYCMKCLRKYGLSKIIETNGIPTCICGGIIRPDVTLYEEALKDDAINKSLMAIHKADLLIVVGTSLLVYPAASLVHYFSGENLVIINRERTPYDLYAQLVIHEPLETILTPKLIDKEKIEVI